MSSQPAASDELRFPAPADDLCLRFANTRYWRGSPQPTEDLNGVADVRRWAVAECGVPPDAAERLSGAWDRDQAAADAAFAAAIRLRETIFGLFAALSAGQDCKPADLAALNGALAEAPDRVRIALAHAHGGWAVRALTPAVPVLLAPVLWSAGDLLLGPRAGRVRQCANPACQWLFLDDSKSGNRRWCSMSACGNRAKAHRHYLKQKQARA